MSVVPRLRSSVALADKEEIRIKRKMSKKYGSDLLKNVLVKYTCNYKLTKNEPSSDFL